MIHVDRSRVKPPAEVAKWRETGLAELRSYFELSKHERSQRRPPFVGRSAFGVDVLPALRKLFHDKCGYCETPLTDESSRVVERFRTKARASSLDGDVSPEHYSWLAYEWDNFVLCCPQCARYKSTFFPVAGSRAAPWTTGEDLAKEKPLLVDPGSPKVRSHFVFELDGRMSGSTRQGSTTIELLNLNRSELVTARNRAAAEVNRAFRDLPLGTAKQREKALAVARKLVRDELPYAAAREEQLDLLALEVSEWSGSPKPTRQRRAEPAPPPFWAEDYGAAVWLERVEIENFRVLHHVELEFPPPRVGDDDDLREPWIMLLGENGVGKSSILKAIALAMSSPAKRRKLAPRAGDLFNRRVRKGTGAVRLFFSGSDEPLELLFSRGSDHFRNKGVMPRMPTLAYGSTRLLPPSRRDGKAPQARRVQIDNLFDPRAPLTEAEVWLTDTERLNAKRFNLLATSLKTLLSLGDDERIYRRKGELFARLGDTRVSIREFSDGYQSLFAVATDLMLHLSRASFDMDRVAGLVLLDELEVHLHPQWKIEVVGTLRQLFPHVRFLVTTHDPLCLHGLHDGEVHVLNRDPETGRVDLRQVDVPPGLRADQLLTGFWFGLSSTRDDETLRLMQRHGELLQVASPSAQQGEERREIERELDERLRGFDRLELEAETRVRAETQVQRPRTKAQKQALREKILSRRRALGGGEG